jgi:hypothetical protein
MRPVTFAGVRLNIVFYAVMVPEIQYNTNKQKSGSGHTE